MVHVNLGEFIKHSFPEIPDRNICITTTELSGSNGSTKHYFKNFTYDEIVRRPELIEDKAFYVGISTIDGKCDENGNVKRTKDHLQNLFMIVLDDIGQIKDGKMIEAPPVEPSYKIETSPGNFQYGYYLVDINITDPGVEAKCAAFIEACIEAGYSDPGAQGTYRVVRAPGSVNVKDGMNGFRAKVVDWNPNRYWKLEDLATKFEITDRWEKIQKTGGAKNRTAPEVLATSQDFDEFSKALLTNPVHLTSDQIKIADILFLLREMTADSLNDDYHLWLKVGMSLSTLRPEALGYEIFHKWSQAGSKYNPAEWPSKWNTFKGKGLGLNTLFHMATERGVKTSRNTPLETDLLRALSGQCFYTVRGGKSVVGIAPSLLAKRLDPGAGVQFLAPQTFFDVTASLRTLNPEGEIQGGVGQRWFKSPYRRQYTGVTLTPPPYKVTAGYYNLWQGFSASPNLDGCPRFQKHIEEVLAGGNPEYADYLIKFFAWTIQNPGKIPGVMLVLKGEKGVGKSVVSMMIMELFGAHGYTIDHEEGITGRFNAVLEDKCFVALEEAQWAGDRKGGGKMKALITGSKVMYEAKGKDAYMGVNRTTYVMTTNHDWAVPASGGERRYAVFDVSDRYKGDTEYFRQLFAELDRNPGAVLGWLQQVDTTNFHPGDCVPQTEALKEQKELSQGFNEEHVYRFLINELQKASPFSRVDLGADAAEQAEYIVNDGENLLIPTKWLRQKVLSMIHKTNRNTTISATRVTKDLNKLLPGSEAFELKRVTKTNVVQYNLVSIGFMQERLIETCGLSGGLFSE